LWWVQRTSSISFRLLPMWKRLAIWMMFPGDLAPFIGFDAIWLAAFGQSSIEASDRWVIAVLSRILSLATYYLYLPLYYDIIWSTHSGRNGIGNN
jgi:hypothetical protein